MSWGLRYISIISALGFLYLALPFYACSAVHGVFRSRHQRIHAYKQSILGSARNGCIILDCVGIRSSTGLAVWNWRVNCGWLVYATGVY